MRKPTLIATTLLVLAFLGWGGYWLIGSIGTERALAAWFEARRAEGWVADYTALDTGGFPNRFDTTITEVKLADPDTGVGWSAPVFQNLSLSYKPTHAIAVFPGAQVFSTPDQSITISAETMRASLKVRPELSLPVESSVIEIVSAGLVSSKGWIASLERGQVSMRETPGAAANTYDLAISAELLNPGQAAMSRVGNIAGLPDVISGLNIAATIDFDAPWDRFAIEKARPQPRSVALQTLSAQWGDLDLRALGALDIDAEGSPTGEIAVTAKNWRAMIEIARATGALREDLVSTVTRALEFVARLSGDPETLDVPLRFERGLSYLGPVLIGKAPSIRLP